MAQLKSIKQINPNYNIKHSFAIFEKVLVINTTNI